MSLLATLSLLLALCIHSTDVSFEPWSYTDKDLFPSAIVSTATVDWNGQTQTAEDKKNEEDPELESEAVPIFGDENGWLGLDLRNISDKLRQKEFKASLDTFQTAVSVGNDSLVEHADAMVNGADPDTQLISIEVARKLGVMPIASGREKRE